MAGNHANGHRARQLARWLRAQGRPCWICRAFGKSGAIDYSLPALHPLAFEVDHLVPTSKGGALYARANVDAAHRCCNQWRGNRSVDEVLRLAREQRSMSFPVAPVRGSDEPSRSSSHPLPERVDGVTSPLSE